MWFPTRGADASDGIAGERIQEIFDEVRRIRRHPIGRMSVSLCRNFLNPFLASPVSPGMRDGLNATRLTLLTRPATTRRHSGTGFAFGPIIRSTAAVGEDMSDAI
jgi:hypothetical protein